MSLPSILDLNIPLENRNQLKEAFRLIQEMRVDPSELLAWDPEAEQALLERRRHELALSLVLVQSLRTGKGDAESRVKSVQRLYTRNLLSPGEAIRSAELLFRSRMSMGATDVETFWLAASFAHALRPLAGAELAELSWQYLCYAPFALDPFTALAFATVSREVRREKYPKWPLELAEHWLTRPEQADLGASLLEAVLCSELEVHDMRAAMSKLGDKFKSPSDRTTEALETLARYYVSAESIRVYAREVIRTAALHARDPVPLVIYLHDQLFDLPYKELYDIVKEYSDQPETMDAIHAMMIERDRLGMARRLVECELVLHLDPWRIGEILPHIREALNLCVEGKGLETPRIRELAIRLAVLHSRTRHFTQEGQSLALKLTSLPEYSAAGSTLGALRKELEKYLQDSNPKVILRREQESIADTWHELDDAEKRMMDGARVWMERRFRLSENEYGPSPLLQEESLAEAMGSSQARDAEHIVEKALWQIYHYIYRGPAKRALRREVEEATGLVYAEIHEANAELLEALAQKLARRDRVYAASSGALVGLVGGPGGMVLDAIGTILIAARTAARIGACFGIDPGTRRGFAFVLNALLMSVSSEPEEGLVATLMDQRPHAYRALAVGGIHMSARATRRAMAAHRVDGLGGFLAEQIQRTARAIGLSLSRRAWLRVVPVLGAVFSGAANYLFMRELSEAAIHLASRRWVLNRHGLVEQDEGDSLDAAEEALEAALRAGGRRP